MPVVGSSAYNTAGQITSLVRSLLNDAQGNLFTDTVLLPYANSAYRKTQRALGAMIWGEAPNALLYYSAGIYNGDGPNRQVQVQGPAPAQRLHNGRTQ